MNRSLYLEVFKNIESNDELLKEIKDIDDFDDLFNHDYYGIQACVEYINYLILDEFENDYFNFVKEIHKLENELPNMELTIKEYILMNFSFDNYDKDLLMENKIYNIFEKYKKIILSIKKSLSFTLKGEKNKFILKDILGLRSSEEIFNIKNQPKNTCPMIDVVIENNPSRKLEMEKIRNSCEEVRAIVSDYKDFLWSNSSLEFELNVITLSFENVSKLNLPKYYFQKDSINSKSLDNLEKLVMWGEDILSIADSNIVINNIQK